MKNCRPIVVILVALAAVAFIASILASKIIMMGPIPKAPKPDSVVRVHERPD